MKQRFATAADGGSPSAVFFRWLGWMLALNVTWEIAQVRLYTLPPARFPFYTAYSIAHCSIGDMLIASVVYLGASLAVGWRWPIDAPLRGLSAQLPLAVAYTAYSEWRNVYVTASWGYDTAMPTVFGLGLSPLVQWLAIPPIAVLLVRRGLRR